MHPIEPPAAKPRFDCLGWRAQTDQLLASHEPPLISRQPTDRAPKLLPPRNLSKFSLYTRVDPERFLRAPLDSLLRWANYSRDTNVQSNFPKRTRSSNPFASTQAASPGGR